MGVAKLPLALLHWMTETRSRLEAMEELVGKKERERKGEENGDKSYQEADVVSLPTR